MSFAKELESDPSSRLQNEGNRKKMQPPNSVDNWETRARYTFPVKHLAPGYSTAPKTENQ
jgi:hypothetical protein